MSDETALIKRLYDRLNACDADGVVSCYHDEATFSDPVFRRLRREELEAMWRMLLSQGSDLQVQAYDIEAGTATGSARWDADYTFQPTGRRVHNRITSRFRFRDGRIIAHVDTFNLWRWTGMALGPVGWVLGWSPLVRAPLRTRARRALLKVKSRARTV